MEEFRKDSNCSNKKIIYILGAGRSGTTLLDIILGNGNNMFSCGEINRFTKRGGISPNCNPASETYRFWNNIKLKMEGENPDYKDLRSMYALHKKYEYHSGFFLKSIFNKEESDFKIYANFIKKIYHHIFQQIPKDIIVESSKYPGRAVALSGILGYEICYIFLLRNPVSVVNAFRKKNIEQPNKGWLGANLYYLVVNSLCNHAYHRLKRKHKVYKLKYEDLLSQPLDMLTEIEKAFDLDLNEVKNKIDNRYPLEVGNLFDGNRIRHEDQIVFNRHTSTRRHSVTDFFTRTFNYLIYR